MGVFGVAAFRLMPSMNRILTTINAFKYGVPAIKIIHNELIENKIVCFTDGDIVFLNKNFMNYCLDYIQDNDIVIQNDTLSNSNHENLCSGFMFIKSSKKTIDIFNPKNVEKYVKPGWDDQVYINKIK